MNKKSAGILLYRIHHKTPEVFLVHPGGPFWSKKDAGAWSIPKGEFSDDENPLSAAQREFKEETGMEIFGDFIPMKPLRHKSGKIIHAWMIEGDFDADTLKSNSFEIEWPPGSGCKEQFPEVDRGEWFPLKKAMKKIQEGQAGFIAEMEKLLSSYMKKNG